MHSFNHILHEIPTILDILPPAALKALSATCRSLRTSFCAQVTVMTVTDPADLSKLCCTTWPQLMMVVCNLLFDYQSKAACQLLPEWEMMAEFELLEAPGGCLVSRTTIMLVRPHRQLNKPLIDLPSQHCAAVSAFADKCRDCTPAIMLRGPCIGFRAVQSLTNDIWPAVGCLKVIEAPRLEEGIMSLLINSAPLLQSIIFQDCFLDMAALLKFSTAGPRLHTITLSNNQLDATAVSSITQVTWPQLGRLLLNSTLLDAACMQHFTSCSWPALHHLALEHADLDAPALHCLAQGQWPALGFLNLKGNNVGATGVSYLVQGNWPRLGMLVLSDQGLDAEACSLLGIAEVDRVCSTGDRNFKSALPEFSDLTVQICRG